VKQVWSKLRASMEQAWNKRGINAEQEISMRFIDNIQRKDGKEIGKPCKN
jgi:hypothetical protein